MRYGYKNNVYLINNFRIEHDSIIVTFLDGSEKTIANTEENKERLLNTMMEQAKCRDENISIHSLEKEKLDILMEIIANGYISTAFLVTSVDVLIKNPSLWKYLIFSMIFIPGISGIYAASKYINYKQKAEEIKELKKYRYFIRMMQYAEENPNIKDYFQTISLDINTLDKFSSEEIFNMKKRIRKSLRMLNESID